MKPGILLKKWIDLFNAGDAQAISELYSENAINHQVANDPVSGRMAIRDMFQQEFSAADMVCIPENIFEDGDWAILEWKDPNGLRGVDSSKFVMIKSFSNVAIGINFHF